MTLSRRALLTSLAAHLTPRRSRPVAFTNPITGGQGALVRPAIKSPNYVTGVSGWTINRDGSAEFNNLTIRGTFKGTDFIVDSDGAFFYSGAPASGNLIASIASAAGTDSFGNKYLQGVTASTGSVASSLFASLQQGELLIGQYDGTATPDTTDAVHIFATPALGQLSVQGLVTAAHAGRVTETYTAGSTSGGPNANSPSIQWSANGAAVYGSVLGAIVGGDPVNGIATWQSPAYSANWATSTTFNGQAGQMPLKFRKDNENGVRIIGTAAATTGAGASPFTLPAGYRPTLGAVMVPAMQFDPTSGKVITAMVRVDASGSCTFSVAQGFASIVNGTQIWIDGTVPLGDIP